MVAAAKQARTMPSKDKRWLIVDATMRRHGYAGNSLIETLHVAQESFAYLDEDALRFVASSLSLPLSKVYGVATFYHHFTLKPQGEHTCVVCMGTACYIKSAAQLLTALEQTYHVKAGQTTKDEKAVRVDGAVSRLVRPGPRGGVRRGSRRQNRQLPICWPVLQSRWEMTAEELDQIAEDERGIQRPLPPQAARLHGRWLPLPA